MDGDAEEIGEKEKRRLLRDAFLAAFPTYASLKQVVFLMGENIEVIGGNGSQPLSSVVLDVIVWAESQNKEHELINVARKLNPGNRKLQEYYLSKSPSSTATNTNNTSSHTDSAASEMPVSPTAMLHRSISNSYNTLTEPPTLLQINEQLQPDSIAPPTPSIFLVPSTPLDLGTETPPILNPVLDGLLPSTPSVPRLLQTALPETITGPSPKIAVDKFQGQPDPFVTAMPHSLINNPLSMQFSSPSLGMKPFSSSSSAGNNSLSQSTPAQNLQGTHILTIPSGKITLAVYDPAGSHLACLGEDGVVRVYKDVTVGSTAHYDYDMAFREVSNLALSPDGVRVAIVYREQNRRVTVVNTQTGKDICTYESHSDGITALSWSPDGQLIASASKDGIAHVWQIKDGTPLRTYKSSGNGISCLCWSNHGFVASTSLNSLHIWNAHDKQDNPAPFSLGQQDITALAWSPNNQYIAITSSSCVYVHQIQSGKSSGGCKDDILPSTIVAIAWSPNGASIISAGRGIPLRVWKAVSGEEIYRCSDSSKDILAATWQKSNEITTISVDGKIFQWNITQ